MKPKLSDDYLKVVEWSEEDKCYIGTSPGLFDGGVHGKDESAVFTELCSVVENTISLLKKNGRYLPTRTSNKKFSGNIALRIPPELHKALALRAMQFGESVNKFIRKKLESAI